MQRLSLFLGMGPREPQYTVRGIKRWPLKTPYTAIASDLAQLTRDKPLAGCTLGIDGTGVGAAVLELIQDAKPRANIVSVLITSGHQVARVFHGWHVPKKELCGTVNTLLQTNALEIPTELPDAKTLGKELLNFRAKISAAGNETMEADWRSRQHDDLVLALAIAVWLGEGIPRPESRPPVPVNTPGWR